MLTPRRGPRKGIRNGNLLNNILKIPPPPLGSLGILGLGPPVIGGLVLNGFLNLLPPPVTRGLCLNGFLNPPLLVTRGPLLSGFLTPVNGLNLKNLKTLPNGPLGVLTPPVLVIGTLPLGPLPLGPPLPLPLPLGPGPSPNPRANAASVSAVIIKSTAPMNLSNPDTRASPPKVFKVFLVQSYA